MTKGKTGDDETHQTYPHNEAIQFLHPAAAANSHVVEEAEQHQDKYRDDLGIDCEFGNQGNDKFTRSRGYIRERHDLDEPVTIAREESTIPAESTASVHVPAALKGKHRSQFANGESTDYGAETSRDPREHDERHASQLSSHGSGCSQNSRANGTAQADSHTKAHAEYA